MTTDVNPLDQVPKDLLTIFTEPGVGSKYLQVGAATFSVFWVIIYGWKKFFDWYKRDDSKYKSLPENFKWYYVQNWAGNTHHATIFIYCMYVLFGQTCSKDGGNKLISAATGDKVCMLTVHKEMVYGISFTMGFLL